MPVIDRSSDTYRFFTFTPTLLLLLAYAADSPHELVAPSAPMPSTVEAHCRVTYVDSDDSDSVSSGDRLIHPSEDPDAGPFDDSIVLTRENDALGQRPQAAQSYTRQSGARLCLRALAIENVN